VPLSLSLSLSLPPFLCPPAEIDLSLGINEGA